MSTCIYCDSENPECTGEHVFPAGLGGDDKRFILKDLVCGRCNTKVFSPLETQLMRNSPAALARLYEQPTGRGKGGKAQPPELHSRHCEVTDSATGRISEAEMLSGGVAVFLPQLQISGDRIEVGATDGERLATFIDTLTSALGDFVQLIAKLDRARFNVATLRWNGEAYDSLGQSEVEKAPQGIWLEPLNGSDQKLLGWPRLYQRSAGQLVLRVAQADDAADFLSKARAIAPQLKQGKLTEPVAIENPEVHIGMAMRPLDFIRATVKIGVNIACRVYGEDVVRSAAFDNAKRFVLEGGQPILPAPGEVIQGLNFLFGLEQRQVHMALLYPAGHTAGNTLMFFLRLYGGGIEAYQLAQLPKNSSLEPVVLVVRYLEQKIEQLPLADYVAGMIEAQTRRRGA